MVWQLAALFVFGEARRESPLRQESPTQPTAAALIFNEVAGKREDRAGCRMVKQETFA
jgi:hypothetical protein